MKKKVLAILISILFSIFPILLLFKYVKINLISIILIFLFLNYCNYKYINDFSFKKIKIIPSVFCLFFSFCQVVGFNCYTYDNPNLHLLYTWIVTLLLFLSLILITHYLFNLNLNIVDPKIKLKRDKLFKYDWLVYFLCLFIAWLPVLILYYPGNFAYDAAYQTKMYFGQIPFNMHHPVLHTLLLGGFINLGLNFFNYEIGLLMYSLFQMIVMASIFTAILKFLIKHNVKKSYLILSLLFFMLLPTFALMNITTTKDVIFSGLFNLVVMYLIEFLFDEEYSKKFAIYGIFIISLALLFRNNMIFVLILTLPVIIIFNKSKIKKIIVVYIMSFFIYALVFTLFLGIGINLGSNAEYFSVPLQQLARVYNYKEITNDQKNAIEKLITYGIDSYNPRISDPVKGDFNFIEFNNNKKVYLGLYFELAQKYPLTYLNSYIMNTYSYFYVYDNFNYLYIPTFKMSDNFDKEKLDKNIQNNFYDKIVSKSEFKEIPFLNFLMRYQTYTWLVMFSLFKCIYFKKYKSFSILCVYLGLFITVLLGPVALIRYIYMFVCGAPLIIYLLSNHEKFYFRNTYTRVYKK